MTPDRIGIIENSYDLGVDERAWTAALLEGLAPFMRRGLGCFAYLTGPGGRVRPDTAVHAEMTPDLMAMFARLPATEPGMCRRASAQPAIFTTLSEGFSLTVAQAKRHKAFTQYLHPFGVSDILAFTASGATGGAIVAAPMPDTRRPTAQDRRRWAQVAAHVTAGQRLRLRLQEAQSVGAPAAVLDPKRMKVVHAEGEAQGASALESLREAAVSMDRARGRLRRSDEDEALEQWRALVEGRWSLVDQFESDGRRYLVAHANAPDVIDPRGLTLRERQVLALAIAGHPLKLIAYELGLSVSTISTHRTDAMRKLGIRSLTELAAIGPVPGPG